MTSEQELQAKMAFRSLGVNRDLGSEKVFGKKMCERTSNFL